MNVLIKILTSPLTKKIAVALLAAVLEHMAQRKSRR
jgi:hypothetical protein